MQPKIRSLNNDNRVVLIDTTLLYLGLHVNYPILGKVVVYVDMDRPIWRNWLHTNKAIAIPVGGCAGMEMLVLMILMMHSRYAGESCWAITSTCRKSH